MRLCGLSVTLSGIGFGLAHIMSERKYQPSACKREGDAPGDADEVFGFDYAVLNCFFISTSSNPSLSKILRRCPAKSACIVI
jgi:hypothetical protein